VVRRVDHLEREKSLSLESEQGLFASVSLSPENAKMRKDRSARVSTRRCGRNRFPAGLRDLEESCKTQACY
jgi:hypothetical protein